MKKQLVLFLFVLTILIACTKEKASSTVRATDPVDTTAQLKYRGVFSDGPWGATMGVVKIYVKTNVYTLVLDSFTVSNGPDLHVYIAKEVQPINFIDLGRLRSTNGRQVYNISGVPDFMAYKYALVHCQQYDHLFGSAILQ